MNNSDFTETEKLDNLCQLSKTIITSLIEVISKRYQPDLFVCIFKCLCGCSCDLFYCINFRGLICNHDLSEKIHEKTCFDTSYLDQFKVKI